MILLSFHIHSYFLACRLVNFLHNSDDQCVENVLYVLIQYNTYFCGSVMFSLNQLQLIWFVTIFHQLLQKKAKKKPNDKGWAVIFVLSQFSVLEINVFRKFREMRMFF